MIKLVCLVLVVVVVDGLSVFTRAGVRRHGVDPHRPAEGSLAPGLINAIARNTEAPKESADIIREMNKDQLSQLLESTVSNTPWVAKYKEEARFGLPLSSSDPLVLIQRAECLLGLHLLFCPHDSLAVSDFIEPDRLEVLEKGAALDR